LGLALRQQARFKEGLDSVKQGLEMLPEEDPRHPQWSQWVKEGERDVELDAKLPAILDGTQEPENAAEKAFLAELCLVKKLYATSARFHREAFVAEPTLLRDVTAGHRFNGACAAAMAGCGQGKDTRKLDKKEQDRWRKQALTWLQDDLKGWTKILEAT